MAATFFGESDSTDFKIKVIYQSCATLAGIHGVLMKHHVPDNELSNPRVFGGTADLQQNILHNYNYSLWDPRHKPSKDLPTTVPPMILSPGGTPHWQASVLHSTADSGRAVTARFEVELDLRLLK